MSAFCIFCVPASASPAPERSCPAATASVAAKLDAGGSYYLLADQTFLPSQIKLLISLLRPSAESALAAAETPFSYDDIIAQASRFYHGIGLSRVRAVGQSSRPISGRDRTPGRFRNRLVLDTGNNADVPPFLAFFAGKPIKLDDFLASIPADALGASSVCVDFGAMWRWVNRQYRLPPEVATTIQLYAGCPAEEFFDGISGRMDGLLFSGAVPGGRDKDAAGAAAHPFRFYWELPDRANRVFKAMAKIRMLDPEQATTFTLKQTRRGPFGELIFIKLPDRLAVVTAPDIPARLQAARRRGATLADSPAVKNACGELPVQATGYFLENYRAFSPRRENARSRDLWCAGCVEIAPNGLTFTENDCFDWNGWSAKVLFSLLSGAAEEVPTLLAVMEAAAEAEEEAAADPPESERIDLEQVRDLLMQYREKHSAVPAVFGRAGWAELAKANPDLKPLADGEHTYLLYFGSLATQIPPEQIPLAAVRPDLACDGKLDILFADGHIDPVAVPDSVQTAEELVSYLHTQYQYREKDLIALCERARKIDKETDGE